MIYNMTLSALTACSVLLAHAAEARRLTFQDCADDMSGGLEYANEQNRDLGNGYVATKRVRSDSMSIMSCATGETLSATVDDQTFYFDPNSKAGKLLDEMISSPEPYSFARMAERFRKEIDPEIYLSISDTESCGCAAAYPKLRGNKTKFDPSWIPGW